MRPASTEKNRPGASPDEYRLRNWLWDRALSGDILVEQNIHIIDLCNWMLGAHPVKATATGGRNILTHFGDCWDNYQVDFTYPGDVHLSFSSTQFGAMGSSTPACASLARTARPPSPTPARCRSPASRPGRGRIRAQTRRAPASLPPTAPSVDNLAFADRDKERTFIDSITSGNCHNQIAAGVETALSCMLGRMAGLQGREVTWEDLLAHGETYELGFSMDQFA